MERLRARDGDIIWRARGEASRAISLRAAVRAAAEELKPVPLQGEVRAALDGGERFRREAHIDLHDAVALGAGQMVVVRTAAGAEPVPPVGEAYTVEHAVLHQHLNGAEDGGAAELSVALQQILPELVRREVLALRRQLGKPARDNAAWARVAQPTRRKCALDCLRSQRC